MFDKIQDLFSEIQDSLNWSKKTTIILMIGSFLFFVVCVLSYSIGVGMMSSRMGEQQSTLLSLQAESDALLNTTTAARVQLIQDSTGLDMARVDKDSEIAETFMKKVLTWADGATYDGIRSSIMSEYNLAEDSRFMKEFLPINVKTEDGKFNYIDTHHYNCRYESMNTYVVSVSPNTYRYFSFVTWSTSDMVGNEAQKECIFTYDVNVDGVLSNLDAYVLNS